MKKDIKATDIIIRIVLFFMWPIGIIPLVISKRIKHKVCIAFIYFALCCLLGLPILMCILLPICAVADGYDPAYGYNMAYDMSSQMVLEYESVCVPILVISSAVYLYRTIQDKKKLEGNVDKQSVETRFDMQRATIDREFAEIESRQVNVNLYQSKTHLSPQHRNYSTETGYKFYGVDYSSNDSQPIYSEKKHFAYQKAQVLTEREKNFYETIRLIAEKHNLNVSAKMRLADIVKVSDEIKTQSSLWWSNFEKISQKHIDFALQDKTNLEIKLLIEIDDYTHQRADRIERDKFVDSVCEQVNIPILHLYDVVGLEDKIVNILHSEKTEQEM